MKNNFKKLGIKVLSMSLACFSLFGAINSTQAMGGRKGKGGGKKEAPSPMSARAEAFSVKTIVETKSSYGLNMEFIFSDGTTCKGVLTPIFTTDYESLHNSMCLLYPNAKLVRACESGKKLEDSILLPLGTQLKWESGGEPQTLMTLKHDRSFCVHDNADQPLLGVGALLKVKGACAKAGIFKSPYDWGLQFKSFEEYFFKTIQKGVLHRVLPDLPHVKRILLCVGIAVGKKESSEVEIMPIIELKMSNGDKPTYIFPQSEGFWYQDVLNFMYYMSKLYPTAQVMIQEERSKSGTQCYPFDMRNCKIEDILYAEVKGCKYPNGFLIAFIRSRKDADKLKEEEARKKKEKEEEEKKIQEEEARKKKEKEEEEKIQAEEARKKWEEEREKARKEELAREAEEQRRQEELAKAERLEKEQAAVKRNLKKLRKEAKKESSEGSKASPSSDSSSSSASSEDETEATLTEEQFLTMCSKKGEKSYRKLISECPHLKEKVLEKAKYVLDNYGKGSVADITKLTDGRWETRLNDEHRLYFTVEKGKLTFCQVGEHTPVKK